MPEHWFTFAVLHDCSDTREHKNRRLAVGVYASVLYSFLLIDLDPGDRTGAMTGSGSPPPTPQTIPPELPPPAMLPAPPAKGEATAERIRAGDAQMMDEIRTGVTRVLFATDVAGEFRTDAGTCPV